MVAEITDQPTKRTQPIGRVLEVLGDHMAAGMETDIAIRAHDLPVEWPEEVQAEIAGLTRRGARRRPRRAGRICASSRW